MLISEVWPDKLLRYFFSENDWGVRKRVYATLFGARLLDDFPEREQRAVTPTRPFLWPQMGSSQKMALLTDWYSVIMPQVQVAELTYILDKLPCIQGIAELFKKAIGCDYLAGHWELGLIESLDWDSPNSRDMASYPNTPPVAPSWSLASVHGKTLYFESDQGVFPIAEFLGASSTTVRNGPTTASCLCRLRIKGPAHRLGMDINEIMCGSRESVYLYFYPGSSLLPEPWRSKDDVAHWDWKIRIEADTHQRYKMEASIQRHRDDLIRKWPEYLVTVREDAALFLVILTIHDGITYNSRLSGIVARKVSEESDGPVLERIGHWIVDMPWSKRAYFADESLRELEGFKQSIFYLV